MINVVVVGDIGGKMGLGMADPDVWEWWAKTGQQRYSGIHLMTRDELDADSHLETVDYELAWCWPKDDPRCIYTCIFTYPDRQQIYISTKMVWGSWGKPWLTAFKRAIHFLHKWKKREIKIEMPRAVPGYRVQRKSVSVN